MNSEDIINQYNMSSKLVSYLSESCAHGFITAFDLLDALAVCGLKLLELEKQDFDSEGTSIVSKAYMFSVVENIEANHCNLNSLQSDKKLQINFDDYIEDYLDEDDILD
jgi:hypothetical protein